MPDYLTASDLAKRFSLNVETILQMARDGRIPCIRISSKVIRFDPQSVAAAMSAMSQQTFTRQRRPQHVVS